MDIEKQIKNLIEEPIHNLGYRLDAVNYEKESGNYFLRIIIDKEGFIDLDDCVKVSELINPMLDEKDLIKDQYILDVCSKEKGSE